jgi:multicomponent Na+:H+ antiporter subunit A
MAYSLRFTAALLRPTPVVPVTAAARAGHESTLASHPATLAVEPAAAVGPDAGGPAPAAVGVDTRADAVPAPGRGFLAPAAVLAAVTVGAGLFPAPYSALVDAGANALDGAAHAHLALWHGLGLPLLLSALTIATGTAMFVVRRPVATIQAALAPQASALGAYEASVRGLTRLADRVTRIAQPGSLPVYLSVIVLTAVVVPGVGLVFGAGGWSGWPELIGKPGFVPAAALLVGGAVAAALASRRFTAALLLGVVGYGMALLFVVIGAPDLALTQFAIETLSVILFLLVLRRLPDAFQPRGPSPGRWVRVGVGATVAAFVFVLALATGGARTAEPRSDEMVERAYEDGGGDNVVNVILVEFRAFDTLGEVTVLAVAAVGATAIARAGRRPPGTAGASPAAPADAGAPPGDDAGGEPAEPTEGAGGEPAEPAGAGDELVGPVR